MQQRDQMLLKGGLRLQVADRIVILAGFADIGNEAVIRFGVALA